ncbi:Cytosine permease [Actinomadura sp. RB99]|uniref:cytosine permease n=1 Tax=Actinomadura sp. RB99 TaxID=2691577 RepID=UPI0016886AAA|nr:cytosine permease [Actinomadura sp. RB99]MBD2898509.1 Cytosine permease [Actinomadura sp. RB99]
MKLGNDDYALSRVPRSRRYGFGSMLMQWLAQSGSLSQFVLGATLGVGMRFWDAFWAFTLGAVILEVVIFAIGAAGQREGLSMTMLTRFAGFGRNGSALVSLVIGISLVGWFGVQNGIFGSSMSRLAGGPPWLWCVVAGIVLTLLVMYGFTIMIWVARIAVPLFFGLVAWSVGTELSHHSLSELVNAAPTGAHISIPAAATIIAGGYMTGAITAPDMTRYNRRPWHVLLQSSCSMILSEYVVGMTGVMLGHAAGSSDVTDIVLSTSGVAGLIIVVLATMKINDWNLYGSSLGVVNFAGTVFGKRLHRGAVTVVIGVAGTVLSAVGFLDHFKDFLSLLGVAIPPIGGIIVAEYWIARRRRGVLDATRPAGRLPDRVPTWIPGSLAVWLAAFCVGEFVDWGIPALNSLITAMVLYVALAFAGLMRATGSAEMETSAPSAAPPAEAEPAVS